jgi:sec-independent protein translocase protein TatB
MSGDLDVYVLRFTIEGTLAMNFLGVGPGELILIFIITLLVVGPERLPGMARQAGRFLVRVRNWMQTSPDAALVLRARQELEEELAQIRSSLLEVQNVRDEVLDVAKQIDEAVSPIASIRPPSLSELIKEPIDKPQPRTNNGQAGEELASTTDEAQPAQPAVEDPPVAATDGESEATQSESQLATPAVEETPDGPTNLEPVVEATLDTPADRADTPAIAPDAALVNGEQSAPAPQALSSTEREELNLRIQALMADLHALQEQLRRRGLLDADWQPPSWSMQLADSAPETPIEEVNR